MYDIIVGRNESDREKFGKEGVVFLGRQFVKMGQTTALSNNVYLDVARAHILLVSGKRGSGKCLHRDTLITLDDGSVMPIKDLERDNNKILSLNEKLKIQSAKKTEFFKRKVNKLIKLKLRSGKEIKLTPEHPLLTIKGWRPVKELSLGSRIATPRKICSFGNVEIPEHEVKLLAYLIAEGHTQKIVLFANSDNKIIKDFKTALSKFDPSLKLIEGKKDCYRLSCPKYKTEVLDTSKIIFDRKNGYFAKGSKIIYKKRSIRVFLEKYKLFGLLSKEKFISNNIMKLNKNLLSLFLNRLFSCDGSLYKHKAGNSSVWEISYSSSSEKLIRQVQHLLLRFGIISKLREKRVKYNGKYHNSFELVIGSENVVKFIKQIGFFGEKNKREKLAIGDILSKIRNPNVDTIPKEIWDTYRPKNWAEIGRYVGYAHPKAMRERIRYSPSRQTLLQITKADSNEVLYLLATSDIFWDEIVSMEILEGNFEVYDLCVPEYHNFIANDIIIHNSYSLGVIAEEMINLPKEVAKNLSILIFDTMGIFWTMKHPNYRDIDLLEEWNLEPKGLDIQIFTPKGYYSKYKREGIETDFPFSIKPNELDGGDWCNVFEVKLNDSLGILIERTIEELKEEIKDYGVKDIIEKIRKDKKTKKEVKDAAENRFIAADKWGLFDKRGTKIKDLVTGGKVSVLDVSCYSNVSGVWGIRGLVIGLVARKLFLERMAARKREERELIKHAGGFFGGEEIGKEMPIVWIMIDEAHEFLPKEGKTPATDSLIQVLREGRQPGISLVLATQQPGEVHRDVITQSDIVLSHRVTSKLDIDALNDIMQTYLRADIQRYLNELPRLKGSAIILDDNSERVYPMRVRPKKSWHGGEEPSAIYKLKQKLDLKL